MSTGTVTINGISLSEGMTLWRLKGLRTYNATIGEQDPDAILREAATQLAENYPDAVDDASVDEVLSNLRDSPGYYDDTDLMNYHAMEVTTARPEQGPVPTEVAIKDLKEQKTYVFSPPSSHPDSPGYMTWESLSALEKHLGTTILPVQ